VHPGPMHFMNARVCSGLTGARRVPDRAATPGAGGSGMPMDGRVGMGVSGSRCALRSAGLGVLPGVPGR
jgi:hypothetical protein